VELAAAIPARGDEVRILEHAQVLHDAESAHVRQRRLQLAQRLTVSLSQPIQQCAPMRVRERPEDRLQPFHRADYM
jgi:hypothetical protein